MGLLNGLDCDEILSLYSNATQNTWLRGLGIPTCLYFGANANPLICILADAKPKICVLADAKPKRKPVEYRLCWVPTQNSGVGHVHFMFFVLISFVLGSQREPSFQWNMGLTVLIRQGTLGNCLIKDNTLYNH